MEYTQRSTLSWYHICEVERFLRVSTKQWFHLMQFVSDTFKDKLISHTDATSWFQLNNVTLGELVLFWKKNVSYYCSMNGMLNDLYHDGTNYDDRHHCQKMFGCHRNRFSLTKINGTIPHVRGCSLKKECIISQEEWELLQQVRHQSVGTDPLSLQRWDY